MIELKLESAIFNFEGDISVVFEKDVATVFHRGSIMNPSFDVRGMSPTATLAHDIVKQTPKLGKPAAKVIALKDRKRKK